MPLAPALELQGISKQFPGVLALDSVDLALYPGEIHALLGENGAGKSTLIKILTGVYLADQGTMTVGGEDARIASPADARENGITLVPQDILVIPELSIGRNILLGMEGWRTSANSLNADEREKVTQALARVGISLDLSARARSLNVPHLRLAQIARALLQAGHVMVLDEPTAVLSEPDSEHLLERLESFRKEGKAILYVTHRLSEVMRLADRITILRDGVRVGHFRRGEISREQIVELMAKDSGRATEVREAASVPTEAVPLGDCVLSVRQLSAPPRFDNINLDVHEHEIVGIAGVQGSGHGQLLRAIAGVDPSNSGEIQIDGEVVSTATPKGAYQRGVLLVPADRRGAAIVPRQSVRDNIVISRRIREVCRRFGLRWPGAERHMTASYVDMLSVRPPGTETRIGTLSGGNQQKVAIARALESNARVLLVEEPTQGIDVRTKAEIHALLRQVARERNCAVVVASSEFEELIGLADTVHVMRLGRQVQTLPGAGITYRQILEHALP